MRRFVTVGLVVALALLLTGCIKFDTDIELNSDNTVDGSVVFGISDDFAQLPGFDSSDLLPEAPETPSAGSIDVEPSAADGFIGTRLVVTGVPIEEFSTGTSEGETLNIVRDGDVFRVSGAFDTTSGLGADGEEPPADGTFPEEQLPEDFPSEFPGLEDFDPSALIGAEVRIRVTFPGEVVSANGTIEGNTVTWTPALGETETLEAVGKASPESLVPVSLPFEAPWAAWFLGVIPLTFLLGGLAAFLIARSRGGSGGEGALVSAVAAPGAAPQPGQPLAGPEDDSNPGPTTILPG